MALLGVYDVMGVWETTVVVNPPVDPPMEISLELSRAKFSTVQGDIFVAFKGTDNRTELSFRPYLKGVLQLNNGLLDLERNGITHVEIQAVNATDPADSITSLNDEIIVMSERMFAKLSALNGEGEFNLRIIVHTTTGDEILIAGPRMPSQPVLTLFPDAIPN